MTAATATGRPQPGEFADYAKPDVDRVVGDDAIGALEAQLTATLNLLAPFDDDAVAGLTYAPGKWTLKEVLGHLADDERIFGYRLLRVARGDQTPLPGFDEKLYAATSGAEARPLAELLDEYKSVRLATLSLLRGLPAEAWSRRAVVNGYEATPRGLAFHIAGHELRHVSALREKYLAAQIAS
ncbi:MAG TPA: DinB family protein [Longimicrobiales bacterium]|nr:DinB family protein [Longimicrobiales bacterium]